MKSCPKCNSSCADEDIICKNCGYLFAPAGFDGNVPPQADNSGAQAPNQNFGNPVPPQDPQANPGQVPPYGNPVPPQNGYGPAQNQVPPQYGNPVPPQFNNNPPQNSWNSSANNYPNNGIQEQTTNGMSIASLVLGILGVLFSCCYGSGIVMGIISLILGIVSTNKINSSEGRQKGKGLALAGIILSAVAIIFSIFILVSLIANRDQFVDYMHRYMNTYGYDSNSLF